MTTYTSDNSELVFLKDGNIAQNRNEIETIEYNAVPSLSLFNKTYDDLTQKDTDLEISANGISAVVNSLCSQISNFLDKSYDELIERIDAASTMLSANDEFLSSSSDYISSQLSDTVKVYIGDTQISNKVKIVKLTNAEYDAKVVAGTCEDAALYVINDDYYSMRGQQVKNVAEPSDLSDAVTKNYTDVHIAVAKNSSVAESELYTNEKIDELAAEVADDLADAKDELSNVLSTYANTKDNQISAALSGTVAAAGYALYDDFGFEYDSNNHKILLTLKDQNGASRQLSVETSDFIKNRIISHIDIVEVSGVKYMRIFWNNAAGAEEHTDIMLSELAQVYSAGTGISITLVGSSYQIAVTDYVASKSDVANVAATVNTLSTTTYSELTTATDSVNNHTNSIQEYINELSSTGADGILTKINSHLNTTDLSITNTIDSRLIVAEGKITAAENEIADLQDATNELETELTATGKTVWKIDQKIDALSTQAFVTLPERLTTDEAEITRLTAYAQQLSAPGGILSTIQSDIMSINSDLTSKSDRITSIETYVNSLSTSHGKIDQIDDAIAELKTDLTGTVAGSMNVRMTNAEDSLTSLNSKEQDLRSYINSLSTSHGTIDQLSDAVKALDTWKDGTLENRLTTDEHKITVAEGSLADVRSTVNGLSSGTGPIPTLQGQYSTIKTSLETVTDITIPQLTTDVQHQGLKVNGLRTISADHDSRIVALETWKPDMTDYMLTSDLTAYVEKETIYNALTAIEDATELTDVIDILTALKDAVASAP